MTVRDTEHASVLGDQINAIRSSSTINTWSTNKDEREQP